MSAAVTHDQLTQLFKVQNDAYKDFVDLLMKEMNRKFDKYEEKIRKLSSDNDELKRSLEFTQSEVDILKQENDQFKREKKEMDERLQAAEKDVHHLLDKNCYLEDASRRNNLKFMNMADRPDETWEQAAAKVQTLLKEELDIPDVQLDRAHRVGSYDPGRTRPIVARFTRYADRECTLRNARKLKSPKKAHNNNIYIYEDLSEATLKKRQSQMEEYRSARRAGHRAYWNRGTLVVKYNPNGAAAGGGPSSTHSETRPDAAANMVPRGTAAAADGQRRPDPGEPRWGSRGGAHTGGRGGRTGGAGTAGGGGGAGAAGAADGGEVSGSGASKDRPLTRSQT